jgi:hypothetical protein
MALGVAIMRIDLGRRSKGAKVAADLVPANDFVVNHLSRLTVLLTIGAVPGHRSRFLSNQSLVFLPTCGTVLALHPLPPTLTASRPKDGLT